MRKSICLTAVAVAASLCCMNAHGADKADVLSVAAFARDARAVVLVDSHDEARRYSERDLLPGAVWRVTTVYADRVVLTAERRLAGQPIVLTVRVGDRIDLAALDVTYAQQQQPQEMPVTSIVTPDAAASTRKPNR